MTKKKAVKKTAKKKTAAPKKKYTKRNAEYWDSFNQKGKKKPDKKVSFSENGLKLLTLEKYDGPVLITRGFRLTKEYKEMEDLIKKMKINEAFIVKREWKHFPLRIVKELELPIVVQTRKVGGNDKVKRVVRIS